MFAGVDAGLNQQHRFARRFRGRRGEFTATCDHERKLLAPLRAGAEFDQFSLIAHGIKLAEILESLRIARGLRVIRALSRGAQIFAGV